MWRRLVAGGLLLAGLAGLIPVVPMAFAYLSAVVDLPAGNLASYSITTTNQLLSCSIPSQISLRKNSSATSTFFQCTNNYNAPVTLYWAVVNDGGSGLTASGDSGAMTAGSSGCRGATLTTANSSGTYNVVFRGLTASTADFFAEIQFEGSVKVNNGGSASGGCP